MAVDRNQLVLVATPIVGLRAGAFADELLSHQSTLIPTGQRQPTMREQLNQAGFVQDIARAWKDNPAILDRLSSQLNSDPALKQRFTASLIADRADGNMNSSQPHFRRYAANPTIETLRREYPAPAAAPAAARPEQRPATSAEQPRRAAPAASPAPTRRESPAQQDAPSPANTAAAPAAAVTESAAQAAAPETSSGVVYDANFVGGPGGLADTLSSTLRQTFPDMENDINTFTSQIKNDTALQGRIAANLTANPGFMEQLASLQDGAEGQNAGPNSMLARYGRNDVTRLLADPEQLASNEYIDGLTSKLSMASGDMSGMLSGIGDFFKNLFGGQGAGGNLFAGIGEFFQNLMAGMQGGNFMAMFGGPGNEGGSLIARLTSGMGGALREGRFQRAFTGDGEFARFGLVPVDAATGRAQHPQTVTVNAEGASQRTREDGSRIEGRPLDPVNQPQRQLNAANDAPQPSGANPAPPSSAILGS